MTCKNRFSTIEQMRTLKKGVKKGSIKKKSIEPKITKKECIDVNDKQKAKEFFAKLKVKKITS